MTLNGDIVSNNGYVVIRDIGYDESNALICHTDHSPDNGSSGGNWFAPSMTDSIIGFQKSREPYMIRLQRLGGAPAEGIYYCEIEDSINRNVTLNVGLYQYGNGI